MVLFVVSLDRYRRQLKEREDRSVSALATTDPEVDEENPPPSREDDDDG